MISKIHPEATIPNIGTRGSVGYDLCSDCHTSLDPQERLAITTGLRMKIPHGHYGRIAPRSGYAYRNGIDVLAGVIDPDYRGEVMVILYNTSKTDVFEISAGQKIAQLILEKCSVVPIRDVPDDELDSYFENDEITGNERGEGGFGSTGQ